MNENLLNIQRKNSDPELLTIESLDLDAQGIAHNAAGKVVFVDGALPFEQVHANINRKKDSYEKATLTNIVKESNQRVQARCPHFGLQTTACGGCKLQHMHASAQIAIKQRALEDALAHIGKVTSAQIQPPIQGPSWGYRYRARLSVRYVEKKQTVLIGFHERKSRYIADMRQCPVLPSSVSNLLIPLRELIATLHAKHTCPQIEVACAHQDNDLLIALVLRHLEPLSDHDHMQLSHFSQKYPNVQWWLQPKGPETVHLLDDKQYDLKSRQLSYTFPEFGITLPFKPTDFTQVNPFINQAMVSRALRYLDARPHERIVDWFCGLGNFTLAISTQANSVLGVEGSQSLVSRAKENFELNKTYRQSFDGRSLAPTQFAMCNLFDMTGEQLKAMGSADKWLIDPPREGAFALVKALADAMKDKSDLSFPANATDLNHPNNKAQPWYPPHKIVYISCNPATLARDAGILVHLAGYTLQNSGIINMFPHTSHVESMAVFEYPQHCCT